MKSKTFLILLAGIILIQFCNCLKSVPDTVILYPTQASPQEQLAAREVRRYVYLRTGEWLPIMPADSLVKGFKFVVVSQKSAPIILKLEMDESSAPVAGLRPEGYYLKSLENSGREILLICGGDSIGTLYGAYRLAEHLGVRFYLEGDVIPDEKIKFALPNLDEQGRPLFDTRGIQPFHDFAEGPDWWNEDDYKAIMAQLAKMRMNFFGLHCYPEWSNQEAEPTVWIGLKEDIADDGKVRFAYTANFMNTLDGYWGYHWGYKATPTGDFHFGASQLFEKDGYGADIHGEWIPRPENHDAYNQVFNRTGGMLNQAFALARKLGIKSCIGTETPLIIPERVQKRLKEKGLNPTSPAVIQKLYEGMFERIKRMHPLDYYWFWTPESWVWDEVKEEQVKATATDLLLAVAAAKNVHAPFTLATCGWVLGPPNDRAQFDRILPKEIPFSCINRFLGFEPVDSSFAKMPDRPKWAIPWMEDDPGLISPQLWAGRMRKDAVDALKYGCTGLLGIHWRTRILGPTVSALAQAGWEHEKWQISLPDSVRDMPVDDFYQDWALAQFGTDVAPDMAKIFLKLDGGPYCPFRTKFSSNIYRTSDWREGPGGIIENKTPWKEVARHFDFIEEMVTLQDKVRGAGHKERFEYWLNTFQYAKSMAHLGCMLGEMDSVMKVIAAEKDVQIQKHLVAERAMPLRIQAAQKWGEMVTFLLQTVSTPGEMGTVANVEQHNLRHLNLLNKYDSTLTALTGARLPDETNIGKDYQGQSRLILPTKRTLLSPNEDFKLEAIVLSAKPVKSAKLFWKIIGEKRYAEINMHHLNRGVYTATIPAGEIKAMDFEYFIKVRMAEDELHFPPAAPKMTQTVVVF